jgi:putative ABC transport system substrate-binding protein
VLAQPAIKVWRVGFLAFRRPVSLDADQFGGFPEGMREKGYIAGQNLFIEWRFADGKSERLPALADELVRLKVDVIVCAGGQAISAAQAATRSIPIVMVGAPDPVGAGHVASLARPGGNITGLSLLLDDIMPKHLEILVASVPRLSRVAMLANPANASYATLQAQVQAAARTAGVDVLSAHARTPQEIESAFPAFARERVGAVLVASDALFTQQIEQLALLAQQYRLPLIGAFRQYADAGALMSYGPNFRDEFRRAATYVDKILKGAEPRNLPVEQPTKFELVVNLKTAKALGIAIPQSVLLRADDVIQ